ncbi:MAG TPA: NAD-dependent epimerase/dehydratase family protein [Solirubrobacterales bacterium]|nr:NAD-dependent epimerase/dehydratase family protein [Solirubrobacterales bacterium]HRV59825.1 NAD-dependent epimerase/dehydratase family protein [Solirubrobacterales bacterium]
MSSLGKILITGGAGFVGSSLAISLARSHPDSHVIALDNLYRRGSELNLDRLADAGVEFVKGDVREPADLAPFSDIDALIECSAEPSVMSGTDGDTSYIYETNLTGAYNCLELARKSGCQFIFLSTSRVYPLAGLRRADLIETGTRFELAEMQTAPGWTAAGVAETMPLEGARTFYGTTKLSAEFLAAEFAAQFGVPVVINRCGVIAGPWQMGKVDQGVFTHWMLAHEYEKPLSYIGFGGTGKQVRDLLHVDDLVELIEMQLADPAHWSGQTFNVGGGREVSLSLLEATGICAGLTGHELEIAEVSEDRDGDVPLYISDCSRLFEHTSWRPGRDAKCVLADIHEWIESDRDRVGEVLG